MGKKEERFMASKKEGLGVLGRRAEKEEEEMEYSEKRTTDWLLGGFEGRSKPLEIVLHRL